MPPEGRGEAPAGAALLRVEALSKHFGGIAATDAVSLTVGDRELVAIIGPNGAGKTTLIAQLSGTVRPDAGRVVLGGVDITGAAVHERVALGLARSYQVTSIFPGFTVLDNMRLAVQAGAGSSFRFWRPRDAEPVLRDTAMAALRDVSLEDRADAIAGTLAHGEQRRLEVGLALARRPRLLLLDEPMAGLGPDEAPRMIELVARLKGTMGILLVEHDMDAVFRLADRIDVLVAGRRIASGPAEVIRSDAAVRAAYLGDDVPAGVAA